jgi:hypothetical protein
VNGYTPRGIDVDSNGVIWTALAGSGHLASFDRRKCRILTGPESRTGQHCPGGWTLYRTPGPHFKIATDEIAVPIIAAKCYWQSLNIQHLSVLPKDKNKDVKPLKTWRDVDDPLTEIAREIEQIVKEISEAKTLQQTEDIGETDQTGINRKLYAKRMRDRYDALDLSALATPGADDPSDKPMLRNVFIPQHARRSRPAQSLPRDLLLRLLDDETEENDKPDWQKTLGDRLPLLIELRDYIARIDEGVCSNFLSYLGYLGKEQSFGFEQTDLKKYLDKHPSLVIFDGLDEIFDPKMRRRIVEEIIGFASRYSLARVLVTSRIAGFDGHPFEAANLPIFTLDDLDEDPGFSSAVILIMPPSGIDSAAFSNKLRKTCLS